jgi:hypothetical protein
MFVKFFIFEIQKKMNIIHKIIMQKKRLFFIQTINESDTTLKKMACRLSTSPWYMLDNANDSHNLIKLKSINILIN